VVRSGDWWAITVPALVGVFSQAKRLDQVEDRAREAISLMLDVDEDDVGDLDVAVTPPARVADLLEALEESVAAADEATRSAVAVRREIAELLRAEGLPMRDVGELIGVSHQRVSQLLAS
jgi:DNA-directed RNA polymerase specialized sigma subunit